MALRSVLVEGYGRTARIDADPAVPLEELPERLPPTYRITAATAETPAEHVYTADRTAMGVLTGIRLRVDGVDLPATGSTDDPLGLLLGHLELWVAEQAAGLVFVHAGCVEWAGKAVLVPGRSTEGKSTLTVALLRAGAGYLSDEFAPIDATGLVHAYPRALQVRTDDGVRRVPAAELGARTVPGPLPVGLVARLLYEPGGPGPEEVSPARGVLEVLHNTVCGQSRPAEAMDHVSTALAGARVVRGTRGEADETASWLLSLVG